MWSWRQECIQPLGDQPPPLCQEVAVALGSEQVVVALVDALGLAVEVGVEAAGVAGEDAAAAGAPLRDAEPRRTGGRPDDMAERGRYAVVAVVRWLELTR